MFIVIDGIDGAGKATQVWLIAEKLKKLWKTVKILDYPRYGETSAFMVEKYLNGEYGKKISPKLASIFYAIDRYDDSFNFREELKKYDYVISNRYVSASMIHQASKIEDKQEKEKFLSWLKNLEFEIFGIPKPDKIIFLNVSLETSIRLIGEKQKREYIENKENKDLHEADENHLRKSIETALFVSEVEKNWIQINCEKDGKILEKREITEKILQEI